MGLLEGLFVGFIVGSFVANRVGFAPGLPIGHTFTKTHFSSGKTFSQHSRAESNKKNFRREGKLHDLGNLLLFVQVRFVASAGCHRLSHAVSVASGNVAVGPNVGQGRDVGQEVDGMSVGEAASTHMSCRRQEGTPKLAAQHSTAVAKRK